jgi:hypothetical protein
VNNKHSISCPINCPACGIADAEVIICYGGAKSIDMHLASTVHCVDDEILKWLEHRERRKMKGIAP